METFSFILGKFLLSPLEGEKYFVVFINLNRIVILYLFGNWKILLDVIYCFKLEWFWILFIVFSLWRKQHCPPTWNDPNAKQNIEWQITQAASFISNPIQQSIGGRRMWSSKWSKTVYFVLLFYVFYKFLSAINLINKSFLNNICCTQRKRKWIFCGLACCFLYLLIF